MLLVHYFYILKMEITIFQFFYNIVFIFYNIVLIFYNIVYYCLLF